jgi:4a-hydroxytetrahydrobiopterin dehydratase
MKLTEMDCIPCRGGDPALTEAEIEALMAQVPGWQVVSVDGIPRLEKRFKFKGYAPAVQFTNAVAALANAQDHHPAILLEWGKVTVTWWTHVIKGLHQNDFVSAAKTEAIYETK